LEANAVAMFNDSNAKKAKIICLSETWISEIVHKESWLFGHSAFSASKGHGKGAAILFKNEEDRKNVESWKTLNHDDIQIVSVFYKKRFQIMVCYIPQNSNLNNATTEFKRFLFGRRERILVGDFNFDAEESNVFTEFLRTVPLVQIVSQPTFERGSNTIDHLWINLNELQYEIQYPHFTDHCSITLNFENFQSN